MTNEKNLPDKLGMYPGIYGAKEDFHKFDFFEHFDALASTIDLRLEGNKSIIRICYGKMLHTDFDTTAYFYQVGDCSVALVADSFSAKLSVFNKDPEKRLAAIKCLDEILN